VTGTGVIATAADVVPDESDKDGAEIDEVADEDMPARTVKADELHDEAEKDAMLESALLTSVLPGKVPVAAATAAAVFAVLVVVWQGMMWVDVSAPCPPCPCACPGWLLNASMDSDTPNWTTAEGLLR
jgi:hypothetical protein